MSVACRVCIYSSLLPTAHISLNINSLDIFSFADEECDLGGDDCEEAESLSSAELMSDTSDCGDVDSMGFLAMGTRLSRGNKPEEGLQTIILLHYWRGLSELQIRN